MADISNTLPQGTELRGAKNRYKIQCPLGQGSFGVTYLATTEMQVSGQLGSFTTEVKVAVKEFFMRDFCCRQDTEVTFSSQGSYFVDYKRKFLREAENLSKLQHPNIVKVLESFEANGTAYYAMEYLEGGSLDRYIEQKGFLKESEALPILHQIGSALECMHAHKMLHLDLKPGNVMLRSVREPVLIDFGLSKQFDKNGEPESSTSLGGGTPGYAPLEQVNYQRGEGLPVTMDIYALGATLYKMLTGKRPPEASDILNDGFPLNQLQEHGVDERTIASITKAMAPIRKDRFTSVECFLKSFDIVTEETTIVESTTATEMTEDVIYPLDAEIPQKQKALVDNGKIKKWGIIGVCVAVVLICLILFVPKKTESPAPVISENIDTEAEVNAMLPDTVMNRIFINEVLGEYLYSGPVNNEGEPDGMGEACFTLKGKPNGQTYKGPFKDGNFTGDSEAVFKFANGDIFVGSFKNNLFEKGKYTVFSSGAYFIGTFSNGNPSAGFWYNKNGKKIEEVKKRP